MSSVLLEVLFPDSVTGNVGDTENDLSRLGNGILPELKSWMRSVVG